MAHLCYSESDFMDSRAATCWSRARQGVAWDDKSEEAENC